MIMIRNDVMKQIVVMAGALLAGLLRPDQANAWATANRYGGSTSHSAGETSHTNVYGGSTTHAYGEGTEHSNVYGGSSAHGWGGGTEHTNAYGGSTSGAYGEGVTHTYTSGATVYRPPGEGSYTAYHPPVAVPYYSASGCYGCAAAAGAVVGATAGAVAGAAAASAAPPPAAYAALPAGCVYRPFPQQVPVWGDVARSHLWRKRRVLSRHPRAVALGCGEVSW